MLYYHTNVVIKLFLVVALHLSELGCSAKQGPRGWRIPLFDRLIQPHELHSHGSFEHRIEHPPHPLDSNDKSASKYDIYLCSRIVVCKTSKVYLDTAFCWSPFLFTIQFGLCIRTFHHHESLFNLMNFNFLAVSSCPPLCGTTPVEFAQIHRNTFSTYQLGFDPLPPLASPTILP